MTITITCDSLQELRKMIESLYVLFPEDTDDQTVETEAKKKRKGPGSKIDREQVKKLIEKGLTNKQIAEEMGCGYSTICNIVTEINVG